MEYLLISIIVILAVALVLVISKWLKSEKLNSSLTERVNFLTEQAPAREEMERDIEARFKALASEALDDNSRRIRESNQQQLESLLNPLRDNIENFKRTFTDAYSSEARERFSLEKRIKEMIELNETIGREARELTHALKSSSQVQGNWGEMVLESILEKSGLRRDVHFKVQQTKDDEGQRLADEEGRSLRPDVVVYYPDGRCIVIDSKVSLIHYMDMINTDNPSLREALTKKHLESVKENMRKLSSKNYADYLGDKRADFVMMFIPNEGAYLAAMNADSSLWEEAYDKRVIIISPTHLISALRLVEQLWRQDSLKRNVLEIADEGGKMYDKFVGFVEEMNKIEKSMNTTRASFDSAMKKLTTGTGSLVTRAEKLRQLGAKTSKRLPPNILPEE